MRPPGLTISFPLYHTNGLFLDYSLLVKFAQISCPFNWYRYLRVSVILKLWWPVAFSDVIMITELLKILGTTSHSNLHVSESSCAKFHTLFTKWTIWSELTHFSPVSHFCTPWKRQKTIGFLTLSGGIEMWHWNKMG